MKKKLKCDIQNYLNINLNNSNLNKSQKKKDRYLDLGEKVKRNTKFLKKTKISFANILSELNTHFNFQPNNAIIDKYPNFFNYNQKNKLLKTYKKLFEKKAIRQRWIKKKFNTFLTDNKLYGIFNLKQDFPYPNYLQLKSEIQRATVFRDLINKEESYYQTIKKSPLIILISPKPKNIYLTVYTLQESLSGYNILWKKSTGMLQKVEGQLSLPALIELFNKLNIFLTREYGHLQSNVRLIIKSTKYYGTSTIIQNFVKRFEKNVQLNYIYFMYKYRKRFNFFTNYANLINDSLFNYLSSIWLKFLKLIKKTKMNSKFLFPIPKLNTYNKFFGIEFNLARRQYKINHFARVKRLKSLQTNKGKNFKQNRINSLI